jgi:hypothetical protein
MLCFLSDVNYCLWYKNSRHYEHQRGNVFQSFRDREVW